MDKHDIKVETLHPTDLSPADLAAWRDLQRREPAFANPLFGPEFAQAVGRARSDARVTLYRQDGALAGVLAYHLRSGGFARPIGSPFSDYQGLVSATDFALTGPEALAWAGVSALRFTGLIDPHGLFAQDAAPAQAFAIDLDIPADAFLERVRAASPKKFKNYRRLEHRMAEQGEVRFVANDRSRTAFDQMLAWKSAQFRQSGLQDVLRPEWVRQMMYDLFAGSHGLMCSLYVGDELVAAHFGVRNEITYHPWIAAANPAYAAFSPGQAFLGHAVRAMPQLGLATYDLGPGHDHYKRPFANVERALSSGLITAQTSAGRRRRMQDALWRVGGLSRVGPVDKIRRRLDHIATVDPTAGGRLQGLAEAVTGMRHRSLGNETASLPVQ